MLNKIKNHKDFLFIGIILISYTFLLINFNYFTGIVEKFFALLSPFIYGFVLAYLLNPLIKFLEKSVFLKKIKNEKIKKTISITISYVLVFIILFFLCIFILPELWSSINELISSLPTLGNTIKDFIDNDLPDNIKQLFDKAHITETFNENFNKLIESLLKNSTDYLSKAFDFTKTITSTIINIVIGLIISLYMLIQKDTFIRQAKKVTMAIVPEKRVKKTFSIFKQLHEKVSKFLFARIIDSSIIGILCYIGLLFMDAPFKVPIATIVGVTNVIPYFGPFIGAIPSIIMILAKDPMQAVIFSIFILVLQQFDGNILGPKLLGDSLDLSAFWIIFAVVMMTGFLGFTGMLIGVPIFAVIYTLIKEFIEEKLKEKNLSNNKEQHD